MQQTEKYKLNLIEPSDPFLPKGLNENTQKIEEVLQTHMEGPVADLENRVTVLEGHRFAYGLVTGDGVMHLGFKPLAVLTNQRTTHVSTMSVLGENHSDLKLTEDGFIATGSARGIFVAFG